MIVKILYIELCFAQYFIHKMEMLSIIDTITIEVISLGDNRIQELRERKNISISSLIKTLNISRNTLYNYESGRTAIPSDILIILSKIFEVSIDYILCLDKNPSISFISCPEIDKIKQNLLDSLSCIDKFSKKDSIIK